MVKSSKTAAVVNAIHLLKDLEGYLELKSDQYALQYEDPSHAVRFTCERYLRQIRNALNDYRTAFPDTSI